MTAIECLKQLKENIDINMRDSCMHWITPDEIKMINSAIKEELTSDLVDDVLFKKKTIHDLFVEFLEEVKNISGIDIANKIESKSGPYISLTLHI